MKLETNLKELQRKYFTRAEIFRREGIYRPVSNLEQRVVVLRDGGYLNVYLVTKDNIYPVKPEGWKDMVEFEEVHETLNISITN